MFYPFKLRSVMSDSRQSVQAAQALPALIVSSEQLSWQERALCAQTDPEAFFPEKGGSTREAKRVCLSCDVRSECLEYALAHDERFGIWGGLSERERRRLKRRPA
jgi:WhiB family transcriptional regulator, redox-sensing transcriptional regulator